MSIFYDRDNLIELNVNKSDCTLKKLALNVKSLEANVLKTLKLIDIHIIFKLYLKDKSQFVRLILTRYINDILKRYIKT